MIKFGRMQGWPEQMENREEMVVGSRGYSWWSLMLQALPAISEPYLVSDPSIMVVNSRIDLE